MNITLPAIINGQTMPGGVDRYRFQAHKGQRLVVAVSARELIPYLADAVPGWFQAAVALYDSNGNELAYDDHYLFHPDPVLYCKIPKDGQYVLEIRDALYRGREDFVYRIAVGELPFVTSVFPLGGPAGTETAVELKGWNLPVQKLTMDAKDKEPGIIPLSIRRGEVISNIVPFAVDTLPECLEKEPNNDPAGAQQVALPIIVNGRIDKPGDWDVFRFDGRAGEEIVADVDARKLDSPLDSVLKLTDADGRQLAFNDDYGDKGIRLEHASRRFLPHRRFARQRRLLFISRRCPAQGRPGIWLPPAHKRAAARLRFARRAFQRQCPHRRIRAHHRIFLAKRRFFRRDYAGFEGRP